MLAGCNEKPTLPGQVRSGGGGGGGGCQNINERRSSFVSMIKLDGCFPLKPWSFDRNLEKKGVITEKYHRS